MGKQKKRNHCLEAIKGMACMLVVFTHVLFPGKFGYCVYTIAMATVPVFFLISGFYVRRENRKDTLRLLPGKIKNIGALTASACLLYFLFSMVLVWTTKGSLSFLWKEFHWKNIATFFLLNNTVFIHGGHLWFLLALLYCYIIFMIAERLKLTSWCYLLIPVTLIGRVLLTCTGNWHHTQNFLFYGVPYFFLGILIKENIAYLKKINNISWIVLFAVSLCFSEVWNWYSSLPVNIFEMGTICAALCLFCFALKNEEIGDGSILERIGYRYSLFIYVVHVIVMELFAEIDKKYYNQLPVWYTWGKPLAVLGITMALAIVYMEIKAWMKKKRIPEGK